MQNLLYNEINNQINNQMKNIIKNDINYLKSFQIGSGKIDNIVASLLTNQSNYETMKTNIDTYIQRLTELDKLIKGDGTERNKGILRTSEQLKPSSGNFQNIYDASNNFGKFLNKYNTFVENRLWNHDRLSLDNDATDQTDPTKYDIFFNIDETKPLFTSQLDDFNEKLKILYNPFITDKTKSLQENITKNIDKIDELIKISKNFNDYIQEKKIQLDNILAVNFNVNDLKIIDKLPDGEDEKISFQSIQLKEDSALNMKSIKDIESHITTILNNIKINDKINNINNVNIFSGDLNKDTSLTLDKLLDVDDVIEVIQSQPSQISLGSQVPSQLTRSQSQPVQPSTLSDSSQFTRSLSQPIQSSTQSDSSQSQSSTQSDSSQSQSSTQSDSSQSESSKLARSQSAGYQYGGNDGVVNNKYFTFESNLKVSDLIKKIEYLFELLDNIFNNFEYMKELQYRYNFYVHYLFLVISESAKNPKMETYQYISKKTAQLYQKIFQNIKKGFTTIKQGDNELEYLNKYHYLTVYKLEKLMNFILANLHDKVIDVNACVGGVYTDLIVFNHFRKIILLVSERPNGKTILGLTDEELKKL